MPVYGFRCPECRSETEVLIPMQDRDNIRKCGCGAVMRRLMSAPNFVIPITGRDTVLGALNEEKGYRLPGGKKHSKRYKTALAKGLDQRPATIGRGFG